MALKPTFALPNEMHHGASKNVCSTLAAGNVDVDKGGGELGKGFYLGNYYHVAAQWARHKFKHDAAVVSFALTGFSTSRLARRQLSRLAAVEARLLIRHARQERKHKFGVDTVHANIVGGHIDRSAEQLKVESKAAQDFLNQKGRTRKVRNA